MTVDCLTILLQAYRSSDGSGLALLVSPSMGTYWYLKYNMHDASGGGNKSAEGNHTQLREVEASSRQRQAPCRKKLTHKKSPIGYDATSVAFPPAPQAHLCPSI